ncbi:MAG: pyridoxal-phosphate dependent enzyme, partial [Chloroflexi bacterium]|nr:pyridoxal-phosphate dependent enzyme [Chloroflexota bacterium]
MPALQPTLEELRKAQEAIAKVVRHTPLLPSRTFSEMTGAQIYLKAENLQRTGSFKIRGAANRIA